MHYKEFYISNFKYLGWLDAINSGFRFRSISVNFIQYSTLLGFHFRENQRLHLQNILVQQIHEVCTIFFYTPRHLGECAQSCRHKLPRMRGRKRIIYLPGLLGSCGLYIGHSCKHCTIFCRTIIWLNCLKCIFTLLGSEA